VSVILALAPLVAAVGCGGPEREIRSSLSNADRQRFDLGQRLSTPCWSCHDLYGQQNKVGPYLAGVYGRKAGSANFPGYSQAMRSAGFSWDERSLRSFLLDPNRLVPGTTMVASGPRGPAEVDALVFYLKHVSQAVSRKLRNP
jgi:cytochrome c